SESVFHGLTYHLTHGPNFRDTRVSSIDSPQAGRQPRQCPRRPAATRCRHLAVPAPEFPLHSAPAPKTGAPTCPAAGYCDTALVRPPRESVFHPQGRHPSELAHPPPTTPVQSPHTDRWYGCSDGAGIPSPNVGPANHPVPPESQQRLPADDDRSHPPA